MYRSFVAFIALMAVLNQSGLYAAQSDNYVKNRPIGINLNIGGSGIAGALSVDYFIQKKLDIEAGVGPFTYFAGFKYHFSQKKYNPEKSFFTGLYHTRIVGLFDTPGRNGIYIPLGFHEANKKGIFYSLEIAYLRFYNTDNVYLIQDFPIWGGLRFGYHF